MAVVKTARTILASTTIVPATPQTSAELDLSTALGMLLVATVTNGATGPGAGCLVTVEVRESGSGTWRLFAQGTAGILANAVATFTWDIPPSVIRLRVTFSGNTSQNVTGEAVGHELTSV